MIEGIAFQTNILALNAAVRERLARETKGAASRWWPARVRTLAQRSASAAKEIRTLISRAVGRVETGVELVDKTGTTIQAASDAIAKLSGVMRDIAAAAAEQSAGIDQVGDAVTQMDSVTQQNAALVEAGRRGSADVDRAGEVAGSVDSNFPVQDHARERRVWRRTCAEKQVDLGDRGVMTVGEVECGRYCPTPVRALCVKPFRSEQPACHNRPAHQPLHCCHVLR